MSNEYPKIYESIDPANHCSTFAAVYWHRYRGNKSEFFNSTTHPDHKLRFIVCRLCCLLFNVKTDSDPDDYLIDNAYMSEALDEVVLMLIETSQDYLRIS